MDTSIPHDGHVTPEQIKTQLDALRVKLHLGGMEAKEQFEILSREVAAFGRRAKRASKQATHALVERIRALEATLACPD